MEKTVPRIKVTTVNELPQKIGKTVKVGSHEIALFHLDNGEIYAIQNRCPHKGGVLAEGIVSGEYVFCPMHDQKISLVDGLVQKPDTGCVDTYRVEIEDENVYIVFTQSE